MSHYDEAALYDYLDDPESFPDRAALEQHLLECDPCRTLLDELRELEAALASTAMWEYADAVRRHREMPQSLRSIEHLIATEDAEAEQFLTPILTSPAAFRRANIANSSMMQTAGVVRKLCNVARDLREKQPMHALSLADTAVIIAENLSADDYPPMLIDELLGNAWLERANALRYLGRYPEAQDALDLAERAFTDTPASAFSIALVDYLRAVVHIKAEHLDEAARLARHSARVFRQFGEDERYMHARIVEAAVLFHRNRFDEALELFTSLVSLARRLGDAETMARLYANIANCFIGLGDHAQAQQLFQQALSLYETRGLETEKIRTRWSLGCLMISAGDLEGGIGRLREAEREFRTLGATTDAALVTLDMAEALLAIGRTAEAHRLCTGLAESFSAVGMSTNALTALA
ncbi:MAG TPA: zf-HC2 domain-containing protein [Thermoanaerobaculia bacterium]|nr:zf-HC2 domain-containing protein [Thermoanaerobaculia bacterium]